jgi:hypothetical protein
MVFNYRSESSTKLDGAIENLYTENSDLDPLLDIFEVQYHTNVLANDPIIQDRYNYRYTLIDQGHPDPIQNPDLPQGIRNYSITISNISVMNTIGAVPNDLFKEGQALEPGDNVVRIYIAQVPEDRPDAPPVFRMAEVIINTNQDASFTQTLGWNQFELID